MRIHGHDLRLKKRIATWLYYNIAIHLPISYKGFIGKIGSLCRYHLCRVIFEHCGKNVNIEHGAKFGLGLKIRIGDNSGLGVNCNIPDGTVIGNNVMMGPNCYVHKRNHKFDRLDIPMNKQGYSECKSLVIEDDVWIGKDVTIMVGRHIKTGSVIAANCVLTKDFPPYSVIGGNPSRIIKMRKDRIDE